MIFGRDNLIFQFCICAVAFYHIKATYYLCWQNKPLRKILFIGFCATVCVRFTVWFICEMVKHIENGGISYPQTEINHHSCVQSASRRKFVTARFNRTGNIYHFSWQIYMNWKTTNEQQPTTKHAPATCTSSVATTKLQLTNFLRMSMQNTYWFDTRNESSTDAILREKKKIITLMFSVTIESVDSTFKNCVKNTIHFFFATENSKKDLEHWNCRM